MDINETLKTMIEKTDNSRNQIIRNAGLNPQNINNKFSRGTLYFTDVESILNVLGYHFEIIPNNIKINLENIEKPIDK